MKHFTLPTIVGLLMLLTVQPAVAQDSGCRPIYGGGVTSQEVCGDKVTTPQPNTQLPNTQPKATPTPMKMYATPTPIKFNSGPTTKGGMPVLPPAPMDQTPSTGPEALGILSLIPAGILGYYLRKKG